MTNPTDLREVLSENIIALCKRRGFMQNYGGWIPNQSALAQRIKTEFGGTAINQTTIGHAINRTKETTLGTLVQLAYGLDVPYAWHLLVPHLNPEETLVLTTAEGLERARVGNYGKANEQSDGRVFSAARDRDAQVVRTKAKQQVSRKKTPKHGKA